MLLNILTLTDLKIFFFFKSENLIILKTRKTHNKILLKISLKLLKLIKKTQCQYIDILLLNLFSELKYFNYLMHCNGTVI